MGPTILVAGIIIAAIIYLVTRKPAVAERPEVKPPKDGRGTDLSFDSAQNPIVGEDPKTEGQIPNLPTPTPSVPPPARKVPEEREPSPEWESPIEGVPYVPTLPRDIGLDPGADIWFATREVYIDRGDTIQVAWIDVPPQNRPSEVVRIFVMATGGSMRLRLTYEQQIAIHGSWGFGGKTDYESLQAADFRFAKKWEGDPSKPRTLAGLPPPQFLALNLR